MAKEAELSPGAKRLEEFFAHRDVARAMPWIPVEGDHLIGTVVDMSFRDSGYGEYLRAVYTVHDSNREDLREGDKVAVHVFHTLLVNQLKELNTVVGSKQIISYLGKRTKLNASEEDKLQDKDTYHDYYVENYA